MHVLTRNGLRSESYWPRTERFAHGPESTAEGFIDLLTTTGVRLASARSAWLGLTGGRDSTLLAACLHQARVTIPTFTWGWVGDADADAAARTAQQLGWPHHVLVGRPNPDVEPYAYLVDQSAWHEGREPANNFIPAFINWPTDAIWWLTGNGGEIGRAFYWHSAPDDVHKAPVAWLMRGSLGMPQGRRRELKDRLDAEFERINSFGRPAEDALDVFYALQRMRKWMPQSPPNQPVRGQLGGYLEPSIVRTLLAVPHSARRDGSFFDEAIARVFPDFRVVTSAQKAGPRSLRSQLGRLRGHLNLARPRAAPIAEGIGTVAEALLARPSGDSSFTSSVMGNRWWNAAVNRSRRTGDLRWLWNALSIDAFAELTRRL